MIIQFMLLRITHRYYIIISNIYETFIKRSNDQPKTQREHVRLVVPRLQLPPGDTLEVESNLQKMPMRMTRSVLDFQKELVMGAKQHV